METTFISWNLIIWALINMAILVLVICAIYKYTRRKRLTRQ